MEAVKSLSFINKKKTKPKNTFPTKDEFIDASELEDYFSQQNPVDKFMGKLIIGGAMMVPAARLFRALKSAHSVYKTINENKSQLNKSTDAGIDYGTTVSDPDEYEEFLTNEKGE